MLRMRRFCFQRSGQASKLRSNELPSKTVVATHYVPVPQATPARYIDSPVREAFVADCSEMVREFRPAYWVHGHSHVSGCVVCGGTRIVSNQLGTVRPQKELNFNPTAVIEL